MSDTSKEGPVRNNKLFWWWWQEFIEIKRIGYDSPRFGIFLIETGEFIASGDAYDVLNEKAEQHMNKIFEDEVLRGKE